LACMKNDFLVEQKVNEALESLDGMQRASANPFLFTRVWQRVSADNNPWERVASFLARPVFAVAVLVFFLSVNIWAASKKSQVTLASKQQVAEQLFASEYSAPGFNLMPEQNADR
jgi:Na+/proline symporter